MGGCFVQSAGNRFRSEAAQLRAIVRGDEARSFKSQLDHRLQRTVEYRIVCVVDEIRDQHRLRCMLHGWFGSGGAITKQEARKHGDQKDRYDGGGNSYGSPAPAGTQPDAVECANFLFRVEDFKVVQDLLDVLIPIFNSWLETLHEDLIRLQRNRGIELDRWDRPFARPLVHCFNDCVGFKGDLAGQHFVKNNANCKDVRAEIGFLSFGLLRRHVLGSSHQGARHGHTRHVFRVRYTEIHHDHSAGVIHHDVLRLEIAMNYAFGVRRIKRLANLADNIHCFQRRKLPALNDQALQITAIDVLHRDEFHALGFTDVENSNHVLVGDLPRENQFLFEAFQHDPGIGKLGLDDFNGHQTVQFAVFRLIDGTHRALAQDFQNFVAA